jgi:hypothetical protein
MRLTLQPATLQDVETVVAFERKLADPRIYGPMLDVPGALEEIKKNTFCFLKTGDIVIGTAAYRLRADNSVYISNVAVDRAYSASAMAHMLRAARTASALSCGRNCRSS